jgi:hypothetical protein
MKVLLQLLLATADKRGIVKTCGSRSLRDHDLGVIVGRLFD